MIATFVGSFRFRTLHSGPTFVGDVDGALGLAGEAHPGLATATVAHPVVTQHRVVPPCAVVKGDLYWG